MRIGRTAVAGREPRREERELSGVTVESVSLGKGLVRWRVVLPPMRRRPRGLEKNYETRTEACEAVKKFFLEEEVDPQTATTIGEGGEWGSARS